MDQTLETLRSALADRYRVEKAVGRGGMATVYLAHDLRYDRQVAIKVLSPDLTATVGAERFIREIKIAAQLSHPNILGVFDSGEVGKLLFYVMPYIEGESLRQKLNREQQLSIDEAIQITCEVAEALGYAHSRDIVHRDVKPENILLQSGRALIADFGIARLVESSAEKLTATGIAVGTAAYMSPEQAIGEATDSRTDIYALGCTLFEMLAGQPPFMGANAMQVMSQHSMATVPEIRVMRHSVPEELDAVIRRAMEKTPADRFQTMDDFKRAVLGEISATTGTLPRYTARYRTHGGARQEKDWRAWLIAGVILTGVLVGGTVLAQRYLLNDTPPPDSEKIAVLYFEDQTGGSLEHLADGVTESLIDRLDAVSTLTVVPANGVRAFRGRSVPSDSVRAAFGVGTLVTGVFARDGERIKLTVRLLDASGADYKRKSIPVDTTDVVSLQTSVADQVAAMIREEIGTEVRLRAERSQTQSTSAWTLAERAGKLRKDADSLIRVRASDQAGGLLRRADSLLLDAQAADPRWAKIPATRAALAFSRAQLLPEKSPARRAMIDSGLANADAAIRLQSNSADAHDAKGRLLYLRYQGFETDPAARQRTLEAAESAFRQAVQFDSKHAGAWAALSTVYYAKPNIPEALNAARRAYEADAYLASAKAILNRLFWTSHDLELYPEALSWCDRGYKRFPTDPYFTECRLWMYTTRYETPNIDSAWTYQRKYVELNDAKARPYAGRHASILVAGAIARAGLADSARRVLMQARTTPNLDPRRELAGDEAVVRAILGDKDEAVRLIESYLSANPAHRKGFATRVGPWWRDLQDHPRFRALISGAR